MGVTWLGLLQLQEQWVVRVGSGTWQKLVRFSVPRDATEEQGSAWSNRLCEFTEEEGKVRDTGDTLHTRRDVQSANLPWWYLGASGPCHETRTQSVAKAFPALGLFQLFHLGMNSTARVYSEHVKGDCRALGERERCRGLSGVSCCNWHWGAQAEVNRSFRTTHDFVPGGASRAFTLVSAGCSLVMQRGTQWQNWHKNADIAKNTVKLCFRLSSYWFWSFLST